MNKIVHMYGNKFNTIMMDLSKLIPIDTSCIALKYVDMFMYFASKKFQLLTKMLNICIVGFFPLR